MPLAASESGHRERHRAPLSRRHHGREHAGQRHHVPDRLAGAAAGRHHTGRRGAGSRAYGQHAQGRGRHILVVDDESDIVRVIANGRRRIGNSVTTTTAPREALALFTAQPSAKDVVLSDLSMPHLSGAALGRRMLDLRPDTPIVLVTGDSAALSPDEARAAGFRVVLQAPMSLAVLAESLHRALLEPTTV